MTKNKFNKMIWQCLNCECVWESDPLEHHKMDICKCGETGVDLETYSCRFMGNIKLIERIKINFIELRMKPCWGTYGKDGNEEYRKISVSEMSIGHMNAILETQEPSDYIKWLIKKEKKFRKKIDEDYDIGEELKMCAHEQGFSNTWNLGDGLKIYLNFLIVNRLMDIKKEIYYSF